MNEFIRMVYGELGTGILRALLVLLLTAVVMGLAHRRHRRKYGNEKPFPWKRSILILLLVGYLAVLEYATLSRLGASAWGGANLQLFRAWREAWNSFSIKDWANILLNIAMFMPLGVLVPLVFPKCRKGLRMLAVCFGTTLTVELLQWLVGNGVFDVDDLLCNTVGGLMGYFALLTVSFAAGKKWGKALGSLAGFLLPVGAVGCVFLAYQLQPYGNLPEDPVCRIDTKNVTWELECALPAALDSAPVYQANAMTVEECDAFALEFAKIWCGAYDDILYYDKETYFRDYDTGDGIHYLTVSHLDGGYEYWGERDDFDYDSPVWAELDREGAERLLTAYGIQVPEAAEFTQGGTEYTPASDGWLCFRAEQLVTDDGLVDGTLYCRTSADGAHITIRNHLITYAYRADETIISPEEAYRRLCEGDFNGEWFERRKPAQVQVLDCTLGYAIDTKGFYQPVYYFEVMADQWDGSDTIMIRGIS